MCRAITTCRWFENAAHIHTHTRAYTQNKSSQADRMMCANIGEIVTHTHTAQNKSHRS
ncbi:hypothetical protein GQ42DRAFT_43719 [Ramicandelaber brevisporus]|nr:hypothetical protein GQ42DRAFT_43719 [Ramicandelaber brevisporus]